MAVRGRAGAVDIEVSFWFFAALAFVSWLGSDAARLLLAAAVHEAGHVIALLLSGGRIAYLSLTLAGARMRPRFKTSPTPLKEVFCVAAGPAAGLLLAAGAYILGEKRLAAISAGLSLFNMIPAKGLDGYALLTLWKSRIGRIHGKNLGKNNNAGGRIAQKQRGLIDHFNKKEKWSKKVSKTR